MGKEEEQYLHEEEFDPGMYDGHPEGEAPDGGTNNHVGLVFRALNKFPDLCKRHKTFIAGTTAVISTSLIIAGGIAIALRKHNGESDDEILEKITEEEIEHRAIKEAQKNCERFKTKPAQKKK